jgi:hypothetical protein
MNKPLSVLPLNLGLMAASPQAGAQQGGYRLPPAACKPSSMRRARRP